MFRRLALYVGWSSAMVAVNRVQALLDKTEGA
jgi:hypothetical protein